MAGWASPRCVSRDRPSAGGVGWCPVLSAGAVHSIRVCPARPSRSTSRLLHPLHFPSSPSWHLLHSLPCCSSWVLIVPSKRKYYNMGNLDPSQIFNTMLHLEPFVFRVFLTTDVGFTLVFNFDFVSELLPNHKSIHISGLKF